VKVPSGFEAQASNRHHRDQPPAICGIPPAVGIRIACGSDRRYAPRSDAAAERRSLAVGRSARPKLLSRNLQPQSYAPRFTTYCCLSESPATRTFLQLLLLARKTTCLMALPRLNFAQAIRTVSRGSVWAPGRVLSMFIKELVRKPNDLFQERTISSLIAKKESCEC
jgi:hypothetical protein